MTKAEIAEALRVAKTVFLAIHERDAKAKRRKLFPKELVDAAKEWATDVFKVVAVLPKPKLAQQAMIAGSGAPSYYADEIKIAEAVLKIVTEIDDSVEIVMTLREHFPAEFAGIRYLPQYVRAVNGTCGGKPKVYFFYRRPDFEKRLPDSPIDPKFMPKYLEAENNYRARELHNKYHARPQAGEIALAA